MDADAVHCVCSHANSAVEFRMTLSDLRAVMKMQLGYEESNDAEIDEPAAEIQFLYRDHKCFLAAELWEVLKKTIEMKVREERTSFTLSV